MDGSPRPDLIGPRMLVVTPADADGAFGGWAVAFASGVLGSDLPRTAGDAGHEVLEAAVGVGGDGVKCHGAERVDVSQDDFDAGLGRVEAAEGAGASAVLSD